MTAHLTTPEVRIVLLGLADRAGDSDHRADAIGVIADALCRTPPHAAGHAVLQVRLDPDDGRRWAFCPDGRYHWELYARRADGMDDGPNFTSLSYLRSLGTVVIVDEGGDQ